MTRFAHLLSHGPRPEATPAQRLQQALALHGLGVELFTAQLERAYPAMDPAERRQMLLAWLHPRDPLPAELVRRPAAAIGSGK